MSRTAWIVVIALAVVGGGAVLYFATQSRGAAPSSGSSGSAPGGVSAAGVAGAIGTALTAIAQTIAGAVQSGQQQGQEEST